MLTEERFEIVKSKWRHCRAEGMPWKPRYIVNNILRDFRIRIGHAGMKPVGKCTIHTLQKCCGQNWSDIRHMNVVKELMSHSNISTAAEFYSTVDRDREKKAAEAVQQLLDRDNSNVQVTYEADLA